MRFKNIVMAGFSGFLFLALSVSQAAARDFEDQVVRGSRRLSESAAKFRQTSAASGAVSRDDWGEGRSRQCRGYDEGWEEHGGGHGNRGDSPEQACSECKREHGECEFKCTVEAYQCSAKWQPEGGSPSGEYEGRPSSSRWEAEDSAKSRCRDENWQRRERGECRLGDCKTVERVVDEGRCR